MSSRGLLGLAAAAVSGLVLLTACSGGSGGSGGSTGLESALGHIANTSGSHSQIWYDDTSELVKLAGASPASSRGFALLRGLGTGGLVSYATELPSQTAVKVLSENYAISAGVPPSNVTLISGGQDAGQTASDLTRLGWAKKGGRLVAPPLGSAHGNQFTASLTLEMAQVSDGGGPDITVGGKSADLSHAGSPPGQALARNPVIGALAGCLGNVVAASIGSYSSGSQPTPSEVATGVLTPSSNSSVPQVVTCAAWPSAAAAGAYQRNLAKALRSGESASRGERFARLLTRSSVRAVGGPEHIVGWQAGTPGDAQLVFQLAESEDLPALPDCQRLPPQAQRLEPGCP